MLAEPTPNQCLSKSPSDHNTFLKIIKQKCYLHEAGGVQRRTSSAETVAVVLVLVFL